ncbi:6-phosphofructokinase [Bdellovibrio reynosensis]|uniref:ATP-dependent 6-phosphofructokinase n=1 Tax=Bdellovibrio reynosensis TaxID=2835041 RepID=A0ABY4CBJ6_9BACT|nr:6-phosphofructokinase [Bdellovibrio reynosensis]UOF00883.1 6-phosphofructokinase [Bdellovibrio reynosensis]
MAQFSQKVTKIGVYTSGGDAPGMNAAIRAVVRVGIAQNLEVYGIHNGYVGMMDNKIERLQLRDMANIIQRGGTVLKTGRSTEFMKPEGRVKAAQHLKAFGIDALVCIGGDGSFRGAHALWEEHQIPCVGVPGTIDNDIYGSDKTIGFDTAVNTALEAIDRIRDTAASHDRLFIIEVMGRNSGFIASHVGLAGGAEEIFAPEGNTTVDKALDRIKEAKSRGKTSSIIITAEGQKPGRAYDLAEAIRKKSGIDAKVSILGHQQRGGSPTAADRILASRMGAAAVDALLKGYCDIMIGTEGERLIQVPLDLVTKHEKKAQLDLISLANILAT